MVILQILAALLMQVPAPSSRPKPVSVIKTMPAVGYRFIEVAHTRDTYQEFLGAPTLNAMGMTVFTAVMDSGQMMIAYGSGGPIQIVASTPERFTRFGETPLINDSWDVVFLGHVDNQGSGLFIKTLGHSPQIIGDTLYVFTRFLGVPDINSRGEVAFYAEIDTRIPAGGPIREDRRPIGFPDLKHASDDNPASRNAPGMGIFVNGQWDTTVAVDTLRSFSKVEPVVSLSDNGQVAFVATTRLGSRGVYVQTPGTPVPFPVLSDDIRYQDFGPPVLTNDGQLCFWTRTKEETEAILLTRGDGGPVRELIRTEPGVPLTLEPVLAYTDAGSLLYIAQEKDGPAMYLTRRIGAPLRIVGRGTPLGGSTVTDVLIAQRSLNLRSQICFLAKLANGEAVIVLATPLQ